MACPKQRLTFASMWAFEDIGVREMEVELQQNLPQLEGDCEYSTTEDVLVIKGKLEGSTGPVATLVSSFIEKQRNKDLLDMPRLRLLDLPSLIRDNTTISDAVGAGGLLALDDDSDEELIRHPLTRVTKFWLSSEGGVGCFASNKFQEMLTEIAEGTGTEIIMVDEFKGLQVSGEHACDVDDAMAKLTRIEKPLSYLGRPRIANVTVEHAENEIRYGVQNYGSLNPGAVRRILADPNLSSNAGLGQMFVTVAYVLDNEGRITPPANLLSPPRCTCEPGKSRIWNDFTFQEVGRGDEFLAMESVTDSNSTDSQLLPTGVATSHPYLSPEKAKQVNQWVVEGAVMDTTEPAQDSKTETSSSPSIRPQTPPDRPAVPDAKRAPGIKVRRAVVPAQNAQTPVTKPLTPEPKPFPPQLSEPVASSNGNPDTPRRKWKMEYEPITSNSSPENHTSRTESKITYVRDDSSSNGFALSNLEKAEGKPRIPTFDGTKYGLKKTSTNITKTVQDTSKAQMAGRNMPLGQNKRPMKQNQLIDVVTPVDPTTVNPPSIFRFDHPALVPMNSTSNSGAQKAHCDLLGDQSMVLMDTDFPDLAGLKFEKTADRSGSASSESVQDAGSTKENFLVQDSRLRFLKGAYRKHSEAASSQFIRPPQRPAERNRLLEKQVLESLEKLHKPEGEQSFNEVETRQFHYTMKQKTAKPNQKQKSKAELTAKKQATLEDAWGMTKPKKTSAGGSSQSQNVSSRENQQTPPGSEKLRETERVKDQEEVGVSKYLNSFFEAIKPTLESTEVFPGTVSLEIQLGLILIPLLPRTCSERLMSASEWSRVFQPRSGLAAPTTKFIDRLTTSGSDVDHIVDLKRSKAEGNSRMFEQEYSEYNISYEYHCRTKANELLIIAFDEQGKYSIQKPNSTIGAVNMHFPSRIWDARAVVKGATGYRPGTNPEFEEAAQYLADHLWVPPDKQHIQILTCLPKGNKIVIEKVFMKRWTRHRHIRPDDALGNDSKKAMGLEDRDSLSAASERNEGQDIFIQVMEVQDLFIGTQETSENQRLRARYTTTSEMVQRGKMWYEISLVSPAIEAILKANANLEVGERTEEWRSADLFGKDSVLLSGQSPSSPASLSPVAAAIGAGGLGDMFRLALTVLKKIDGIGYWNYGPVIDQARLVTVGPQVSMGLDFDELESIKDVESVTARKNQASLDPEAKMLERFEQEFW